MAAFAKSWRRGVNSNDVGFLAKRTHPATALGGHVLCFELSDECSETW